MRRHQLFTLFVFAASIAVCCLAAQTHAQVAQSDGLAAIRTRLGQLENSLHKAEAIRDIKRLQYSYAHYAESGLWLDLGDLFAKDGVAHYVQGDYRGPESLRKFYLQELGRGQLGLADGRIYPHIMIQPVVTVAEDGKTAKGRWHVIAMLGGYGGSASWAGVVYENRYVFEDGVWKINELSFNSQYSGRYNPPGLSLSKWDLRYHFTEQSAGTPAGNSHWPAPGDASIAQANFAQLQQRWTELAQRAQRLRDETDVLILQHSYGYDFDQKHWGAVANLFAGDGTLELGQRGVYIGRDRIRQALTVIGGERLGDDEVTDHLQLAIVVHIAPDGRTAKARGVELSLSGVQGKGAQWEEGIFENSYIKQESVWRIHSVHYYPRVITDFELGWAKDAKSVAEPSNEFSPDRPPTEAYTIYPKMYYARFHYNNPVTGAPVQYPPGGVAAIPGGPDSQQPVALPSPPKNAKEFSARLADLERQIQASIAYDAVENLVSAHGYYLDDSEQAKNSAAVHQTVQPVIHIAPDGKTATIEARLLKVGGKAGELAGGTYAGRAINRAGVWSLQDLTLRPAWSSPFNRWTPEIEQRRSAR
jgi:cell division protein FtsB